MFGIITGTQEFTVKVYITLDSGSLYAWHEKYRLT